MWFLIAIVSRIFASLSVVLRKDVLSKVEPLAVSWLAVTFSIPFAAFFAFQEGVPSLDLRFFILAILAAVFYISSTIFQYRAMKIADLSEIMPLTAIIPILILFIAFFPPLRERVSAYSFVGIIIVVIGAYILNLKSVKEGFWEPFKMLFKNKASLLMLSAMLLYSVSSVLNKWLISSLDPSSPQFVLLMTNIISSLVLFPFVLKKKGTLKSIWFERKNFFWNASLGTVGSILAFWAIADGDIGVVNAVLRINIVLILVFSYFILKEKPKKHAIIASVVMLIGVFLIKIAENL